MIDVTCPTCANIFRAAPPRATCSRCSEVVAVHEPKRQAAGLDRPDRYLMAGVGVFVAAVVVVPCLFYVASLSNRPDQPERYTAKPEKSYVDIEAERLQTRWEEQRRQEQINMAIAGKAIAIDAEKHPERYGR